MTGKGSSWFLSLAVLLILAYSWMPSTVSVPNERSRMYLSVALVDDHSVSIDGPVSRFGNIYDIAGREGRLYSDKAPGASLLGALVYWGHRVFSRASEWQAHELVNLMRTWVMLPIGALGFVILRKLLFGLAFPAPVVDLASFAWIGGSSAMHASTAFMGHQIAAVAFLAMIWFLLQAEASVLNVEGDAAKRPLRWHRAHGANLVAGFSAGVALLAEYQSVIVLAVFAIYVLSGPLCRRAGALMAFVVGFAPGVIILLAYNTMAFGGPFELSYHHLVDTQLKRIHGAGIGGVSTPRWPWAIGGLFSLHRGFFATSPFFLLAFPGAAALAKRVGWRLALALTASLLGFALFIASTEMWYAGWGFGPRLLVPVMGMTMVLVAAAVTSAWPSAFATGYSVGLVWIGVAYHQSVHAVFPELPEYFLNPTLDVVIPALQADTVAPNLAHELVGWTGRASIVAVLVAAAGCASWCTWRMLRPLAVRQRVLAIFVAATCVLVMMNVVSGKGPTDAARTARFLAWMQAMGAAENSLTQ